MFVLYDLTFIIFAIIYLPYFLFKKKLHKGFVQRLGFLPRSLNLDRPVWIHAVSVGEARIAEILLRQLRRDYPGKSFVISTVTVTGNRIVRSFRQKGDFVFYLPLDLSFIVRRVIRRLRPRACIIIETEIWPNLITYLYKMRIPVSLVNARISDRSFLGYRIIKPLLKPILNKINLFCVQSHTDAQRLSTLGAAFDKLRITGNMKFDFKDFADFEKDYTGYKLKLGIKSPEELFVAGSTHKGEEEIVLNAYKKLLSEFADLRLLIAPRHPERSTEIEALIRKFGFTPVRISKIDLTAVSASRQAGAYPPPPAVFILDTVGQLLSFYAVADIVFVGGSLVKKGGHNILEPAFFQKPIIFGPYMFNFRDISDLFLSRGAARMIHSQQELPDTIRFFLRMPSEREAMGKKARHLVLENRGAVKKNIDLIRKKLQIE
ncbi:MAG: 3-deoxy-D-manno-octulosonic acid transferase [Candidatus Omnitrophota bacterium]